ncbi:MAG: 5'-methylthioadenosine/S-adenosylhomocysteine nucleosidase [Candidatus Zixiibacteriota bacterium]
MKRILFLTISCFLLISTTPIFAATPPASRTLILYAFDAEGDAIAKFMITDSSYVFLGRHVYLGEWCGQKIILAESGMGMTNAAMTTQMLIDRFHPRTVLFTGIAGAIDTSIHIGDIVIPSRWCEHDYGYYGKDGLKPEGLVVHLFGADSLTEETAFYADSSLLEIARKIPLDSLDLAPINGRTPRLTIGGVGVTGNQFIDSKEEREWQTKHFGPLTTDMESVAVAQVCAVNGVPFLIIRSASDLAGGSGSSTAQTEIKQFFKVAAANSIDVLRQLLWLMN